MMIKSTIIKISILTVVLFFGLSFNFEPEIILAESFTCDSGDLSATCYINTSHDITGETISGSGNLEIQNKGNLYTSQGEETTAIIDMAGNVEIKFGGKIQGNIDLTAVDLTIESGASINANEKGYGSASGPGKGAVMGGVMASGAGYGGRGGGVGPLWLSCEGGPTYGSLIEPTDIGSGGGSTAVCGGSGGGAIKLNITGTLKVDGSIASNGGNGVVIDIENGGGGSGGSIWIIANTLTGGGSIIANGGSGSVGDSFLSGGGGGGRIAIDYKNINFNGYFGANGGDGIGAGIGNGQQGSIYIASSDAGKVKIKNSPAETTVYDAHIEHHAFIDAIITNNDITIPKGKSIKGNVEISATNLTIESGASINANEKGYGSASGPGKGAVMGGVMASGAGYGGRGGGVGPLWLSCEGGPTYGSLIEPTDIGSGGGSTAVCGGSGGGAIKLNITGTLKVDGSIASNGGNGVVIDIENGGGGSGGSIWIIANTLTGGGSIIANGGSGSVGDSFLSGGGGGGRIAIDYKNINFNGYFGANGGDGIGAGIGNGQQGSIYIASSDAGKVKIKNSPAETTVYDAHIEHHAFIDAIITNNDITIPKGKSIKGNVEISATNLTIESGASINANEKGYGSASGPGKGAVMGGVMASGAGYGGRGGGVGPLWLSCEGGPTYGSLIEPTDIGSGGGSTAVCGGSGGGAIKLNITGTLKVDGSIASNGGNGVVIDIENGGGGSGGSIWIIANTLTGGGSIIANGGSGSVGDSFLSGGGGGGRIAIDCCEITHTGTINVFGGTGYNNGEDGTIHYGPCPPPSPPSCALETESCLSMLCCSSPPAPEPLTCVDNVCRISISKSCSDNDAKDNSISEMGDAIDDVYCTWNIHDGCLVKSGIEAVDGCNGVPSYWEAESCDDEPGTSDLWGEKKVRIDDINNYNIKTRCGVDDFSTVWINNVDINIPNVCCDYGNEIDVTNYFITGWNTIKFKAVDTCGNDAWGDCGGRWFDLEWEIIPRASVLDGSAVSSSEISLSWSDRGKGITYSLWNFDTGEFVYNGNKTSFKHTGLDSDTLYSYKVIATKNNYDSDWSNTISVTTLTFVGIENCCNTIDDDGDGDENGKDSDCQNDVGLAAGDNTICWWTEWDDYSADSDYYSGWYSCPDGYIIDNVSIDQFTEEGCDLFYIYDSDMTPRYKDSGLDGNKNIDLILYDTQKVKLRFTSDMTANENGVKVNAITCSLPISSNVAPVALLNCNPAICSGYIKDGFSFNNDSTDADSTNPPDMNNDIVKSKWYINSILNATYPDGIHSIMDSYFPWLAIGSHEIKLRVEDTGGLFDVDEKIFIVKRDAKADFLCSIDKIDWQNCASFTPTILEYDYVYFKDISTLSEDASGVRLWRWDRFIPDKGWKKFDNSVPIAQLEFTGVTLIRLTIVDDAGRSDAQKYRVPVIIYNIKYEETTP